MTTESQNGSLAQSDKYFLTLLYRLISPRSIKTKQHPICYEEVCLFTVTYSFCKILTKCRENKIYYLRKAFIPVLKVRRIFPIIICDRRNLYYCKLQLLQISIAKRLVFAKWIESGTLNFISHRTKLKIYIGKWSLLFVFMFTCQEFGDLVPKLIYFQFRKYQEYRRQ